MKTFEKGDKAIVNLKPRKVTICKALSSRYYNGYYCRKCNYSIKDGSLYGRTSDGYQFCLKCCEEI
jgi:hypothetical protein